MALAVSSPLVSARNKPTPRDYEDEDRSNHPRRTTNRDLVRDHGLESGRNSLNGLDESFLRPPRVSVSSLCGLEESFNSVSTTGYGRESFSSNFDDGHFGRNRGSVSSENAEISLAKKTDKSDTSVRSSDGSSRGWCNFCSKTGHTMTNCPWHPSTQINWLDGRASKTQEEWPGVDFGDEKSWLQEETSGIDTDTSRQSSPEIHNPRYLSPAFVNEYATQDRSWGKATLRPVRDNATTNHDK